MKNSLLLIVLVLFSLQSNAQYFHEDFENPDSVISTSTTGLGGFNLNNRLQTSGINSDSATVVAGDTSVLSTIPIDLTGTTIAILSFKHICKIDFFDQATVWIHSDLFGISAQLTSNDMIADFGDSTSFANQNNTFHEATWGSAWLPGQIASPTNTWWKEEVFDISAYCGIPDLQIQFRLIDTNTPGGNSRAGWFIDDINLGSCYYSNPGFLHLLQIDPCVLPQTISFVFFNNPYNCSSSDTIISHIYFGDGTDSVFTATIQQFIDSIIINHIYIYPGQYSTQSIFTTPNTSAIDTVTLFNSFIVGDTCLNISGKEFYDLNNDCTFNGSDFPIRYEKVKLYYNNQIIDYAFTDSSGNYSFYKPTLNYTLGVDSTFLLNTLSIVNCPISGTYNVSSYPSVNNDFAFNCSQSVDLSTNIMGIAVPINQPTFHFNVNYSLAGCIQANVQAMFIFDSTISFVNAFPPPSSINGDTIVWNINNLYSGMHFNPYVIMSANGSGLNIGDTVCFTSIISPIVNETNLANNIVNECYPVVSSCDPNNKNVNPSGAISQSQQLNYIINFQNTGTAPAHNVFILDTISQNLDLNTLQILGASHNMTLDFLPNNLLKFNFNNIMLPDSGSNEPASHGYVAYSIKPKPNLVNGTTITNGSHIYFDWNLPVATNSTLNTIDTTITTGIVAQVNPTEEFSVFPNPANDLVTLTIDKSHFKDEQVNLEIINSIGEKVISKKINSESTSINIKNLSAGIYLFHLTSGNKIFENRKVVKY